MDKYNFSPSLMCADILDLRNQTKLLMENGFEMFHLDVMDLHFVSNLALGFDSVNDLGELAIIRDVHLMVEDVAKAFSLLKLNNHDLVTFHFEAPVETEQTINLIKEKSRVGLAISPDTPIEKIFPYLDKLDLVLLMSIYPGFAGQKFMVESYDRAESLMKQINQLTNKPLVSVDGGVGYEQVTKFKMLGANTFVLGTSTLFKGDLLTNLKQFAGFRNSLGT
jgi:ribulose-phosphate 3-epimerase